MSTLRVKLANPTCPLSRNKSTLSIYPTIFETIQRFVKKNHKPCYISCISYITFLCSLPKIRTVPVEPTGVEPRN